MEYQTISISIASRIEWCRRQKTQARTQLEREGWQAEVEGLCDALLNRRVHTNQLCVTGVFKRYVMGFQDGQALLRTAAVHHVDAPPVHQAGAEREPSSDRMGDVNTRRRLGLMKRGKNTIGSVWGHGA